MFIYFFHTKLRSCVNRTQFLLFLSYTVPDFPVIPSPCFSCHTQSLLFLSYPVPAFPVIPSPCFSCHTQSLLFLSYTVPAFPVVHSPRFSCHTQSLLFLSYPVPAFPAIHSPRFSCHTHTQSLLFLSYTVPAFPVVHSPRFSCHTQSLLFLSYSPRFSCHYRNQSLFRPLSRVQVIFDCKSRFGHNMQLCVSVGPFWHCLCSLIEQTAAANQQLRFLIQCFRDFFDWEWREPLWCVALFRAHLSSGAVWVSRWPSWAIRPNKPSGFRGRKELLNHASALVTTCP